MSCSLYTRSSPRDPPPSSPSSTSLAEFLRVVDLARRSRTAREYLVDRARQLASEFNLDIRVIAPDLIDNDEDEGEDEEDEDVDM